MKHSAIIRKENFGYLIYTNTKKSYIVPTEEGKSVVEKVVYNLENSIEIYEGIEKKYVAELEELGIDSGTRIVEHCGLVDRPLFAPLEYYFDFTSKCNLKCPHCYNKKHLDFKTMDSGTVENIISEMYDLGINRLHLAGGEPTIEKKGIANYLSVAKKNGIVTSMATNGTLLDDEMCEILTQMDLFAISISIDGWDETTNSVRRGTGFFQRSVNGTKKLLHYRNLYGTGTEICIKPIYTYDTPMDFFEKMIQMSIDIGVDKIKFANPERSLNHEIHHYGKYIDLYYKKLEHIHEIQEKYRGKIRITNVTNPFVGCPQLGLPGMRGCIGAQELLTINPDGRITPCLMNDTVLGNYHDYNSIRKFLLCSDKLADYIKMVDNEECHSCEAYTMCRGGCQVRKIVEYTKICSHDPLCPKKYDEAKLKKPMDVKTELFNFICVSHSL